MGTTAGSMSNREFAQWWVRAWSNRDVDAVADCFAENVRFVSPRAAEVTGEAVVVGREALRGYWRQAVTGAESIAFQLDHILEDADGKRIVIVYISDIDGRRKRACEFMQFDDEREIVAAEAMHGCLLP